MVIRAWSSLLQGECLEQPATDDAVPRCGKSSIALWSLPCTENSIYKDAAFNLPARRWHMYTSQQKRSILYELPRCRRAESRMPANVRRASLGRRSFLSIREILPWMSDQKLPMCDVVRTNLFFGGLGTFLCLVRVSNAGVEFCFRTRELSPPLLMWHALRRWRGWLVWDEHEQKVRLTRASLASRADI